MSKADKVDFAKELKELEAIVDWFEAGKGDVDQSLDKFERGLELAARLKKHLQGVENKVQIIKQKFDLQPDKSDQVDSV